MSICSREAGAGPLQSFTPGPGPEARGGGGDGGSCGPLSRERQEQGGGGLGVLPREPGRPSPNGSARGAVDLGLCGCCPILVEGLCILTPLHSLSSPAAGVQMRPGPEWGTSGS